MLVLVALVGTENCSWEGTFCLFTFVLVNKLRFAVALVGTLMLFAGRNVGRKAVGFLLFIVFDGS